MPIVHSCYSITCVLSARFSVFYNYTASFLLNIFFYSGLSNIFASNHLLLQNQPSADYILT